MQYRPSYHILFIVILTYKHRTESLVSITDGDWKFKVHLTPKLFFRLIESTCYSKHLGEKIFEFG